jgi:hypothetical protein
MQSGVWMMRGKAAPYGQRIFWEEENGATMLNNHFSKHRQKQAPQAQRGLQRGFIWCAMALSVGALLVLSACGGDVQTAPAAQSLIQDAQKAIQTDTAYHYKLKVEHAGTDASGGFQITAAEGDVAQPNKVQGTGTISYAGNLLTAEFIGVGQDQWVKAPPFISQWTTAQELKQELNVDLGSALSDPTGSITTVLADMQHPQNKGDDTIPGDGDCWVVEGTVPAGALASITGGDPNSTAPLDTTICVAKNLDSGKLRQLFELSLKGQAVAGDTAQTTRTFTFTKFNETVDIEPPPGVTPTP